MDKDRSKIPVVNVHSIRIEWRDIIEFKTLYNNNNVDSILYKSDELSNRVLPEYFRIDAPGSPPSVDYKILKSFNDYSIYSRVDPDYYNFPSLLYFCINEIKWESIK